MYEVFVIFSILFNVICIAVWAYTFHMAMKKRLSYIVLDVKAQSNLDK